MNNLDIFGYFSPNRTYKLDQEDNCFGNCPVKISPRLPFWINQQPFWTYQCLCCNTYQFKRGKTSQEWGGIYG